MGSLTKLLMVLVLGFSVAACQQQKEVVEEKAEEVVEEVKQEMKKAEKSDSGTVSVDPATPVYKKVSGVSGNINSVGSDTMNNLMALWCEGFAKYYPNVRCQIEGKGSSTAPPALIEGTSTF